jgi:two-component system NtrC family sensor kinase
MKIIKPIALIIFLILTLIQGEGQNPTITKLRTELGNVKSDSSRLAILDSLSIYYLFCSDQIDSSFFYANERIENAFPLSDKRPLILSYARMGSYFYFAGKYGAALQILNKAISLSEQTNIYKYSSFIYLTIAELYTFLNQFNKAKTYLDKAGSYLQSGEDPFYNIQARTFMAYSINYLSNGELDSASLYFHKVEESFNGHADFVSEDLYLGWMAMLKSNLKKYEEAKQFSLKGIEAIKKNDDHQVSDLIYYQYAMLLQKDGRFREAITQAKLALDAAKAIKDPYFMPLISKTISEYYDGLREKDSTLFYLKLSAEYYAQLNSARNISEIEATQFSDQMHAQETQAQNILEKEKERDRLRLYGFITGISILLFVSLIIWRNSVQRKKAYALLQQQKQETDNQKQKVETTLEELRSTQAQLIQSEKMASLGELTAGIAHEIQNPLNFVNNFSDVNRELIAEMKEEITKGNFDEVKFLADDLETNEEKINHHGKRADAIVKGMLQHSRVSTGQRELTDINALADEYLRLSYHGMRAKDKNFNATLHTDFDATIGKINIVPQDIGRVLLNLFNNAFYAVNEKEKTADKNYKPVVSVQTKRLNDKIEIKVIDNGNGIPQNIVDKIFQPFFTTKPTGQGTGLGLSLSYDIIKAHSGEIKVETKEGEGSLFIIQLLHTNMAS